MFDTCENQEAAWKWITYMCGQEANSYWNKSIGQLPPNTACYNDDWMKDMQHIQSVMSGDMTAKELLDMWAEHLNEAYANYMAN